MSDWLQLREAYHAKMRRAAADWERAATDLAKLHIAIWESEVQNAGIAKMASEKSHSSPLSDYPAGMTIDPEAQRRG